jgi:hypothetical protein
MAGRSVGSSNSLAQLACFRFKVSKHFLFGLIWNNKITVDIREKLRAGKFAGNPQYGYTLAQLARFGVRVSKQISGHQTSHRHQETFEKKHKTSRFYELRDHPEVLNMDIPWHNWHDLGSESPKNFVLYYLGL